MARKTRRFISYPDDIGKPLDAVFAGQPPSATEALQQSQLDIVKVFGVPAVIMESAKSGTIRLIPST